MSDIKVGDLVIVVKPQPCCGSSEWIGRIFTVKGFVDNFHCKCGYRGNALCAMVDSHWRAKVSRLRRIPPLSELEEKELTHDIPA